MRIIRNVLGALLALITVAASVGVGVLAAWAGGAPS